MYGYEKNWNTTSNLFWLNCTISYWKEVKLDQSHAWFLWVNNKLHCTRVFMLKFFIAILIFLRFLLQLSELSFISEKIYKCITVFTCKKSMNANCNHFSTILSFDQWIYKETFLKLLTCTLYFWRWASK